MMRIIITGANNGIGYHMVHKLLADGCKITVLDIETDHLEELQRNYMHSILPIRCNVKDEAAMAEAVKTSVEKFGGIDIAIHNACICTFESFNETELAVFHNVLDVNYFGAVRLTKSVIPFMQKQGKGKIIFTSSGVGVIGFINISPYASSKGSIEAFAKCMNIEYQDKGITFHIFHPPLTRTRSASGLPVPSEFMADPAIVGTGLAKRIHKRSFIICHSFGQTIQTKLCYLFPIKTGKLMSKMTAEKAQER